ncbi:MAG: hypothetical protein ACE5SW_13085, partial [Nitrososphaeraceae archaeon]
ETPGKSQGSPGDTPETPGKSQGSPGDTPETPGKDDRESESLAKEKIPYESPYEDQELYPDTEGGYDLPYYESPYEDQELYPDTEGGYDLEY